MSGGIGGGTSEGFDLDTKGQIHGFDTSQAAIDVTGNNDYVLVEDSTVAAGIAWKENAHSSVTADSTTTFTNKSIAFSGNTITATLAELDAALGTTGTADATTFLRGDNSWQTAGASGTSNITVNSITKTLATWISLGV